MAELLLKIQPGAGYDDGDILHAFNRRAIRCCHAQHICHIRKARRNASGLMLGTEVARDWYEATHQYRFERVSATEIKRVVIATSAEEIIGPNPNGRGEYMDVRAFIRRRKDRKDHYLFGEDGAEFWYGGRKEFSHANLDKVWNAIETKTPMRESDHRLWPAGIQEMKSHLFVATDDFDDDTANEMVSPELDETDPDNVVTVRKRKNRVDWENKLQLSSVERNNVRDRTKQIDMRARQFQRRQLVELKQRIR